MKGWLRLAAVAAVFVAMCAQGAMTHTHIHADGEDHAHTGQWTVTLPPTCVDDGERTLVCDECGERVTEIVPKLEHEGTWECLIAADCQNKGEDVYICSFCGQTVDSRNSSLGDHEFYWHLQVSPTCLNGGKIIYICKFCHSKDIERPKEQEIPALGHSYKKTDEIAPKLFEAGEISYTCTVCGSVTRQEISSYSWIFWLSMVGAVLFATGLINYFRALKHC